MDPGGADVSEDWKGYRDPALGGPNPLAGPSDHTIPLAGVCGVPSTAKAVSLNLTAVGSTAPGNLVLFPAGQTAPLTSVINYSAGQTRANNATVGLGPNADLALRVNQSGGSVHALVDVVGVRRAAVRSSGRRVESPGCRRSACN